MEKVLEIELKSLGPGHASVAQTYGNKGCVYLSLGNYEKARFHHEKDLEIKLKCLGPDHANVATTRYNIGLVYQRICNLSQARSQFDEAHNIQIQALGSEHPETKRIVQALQQLPLSYIGPAPHYSAYCGPHVPSPYGGLGPVMAAPRLPYGGPASSYGGPGPTTAAPAPPYGLQAPAPPFCGPPMAAPPFGGQAIAPPYGGPAAAASPYGGTSAAPPYSGQGLAVAAVYGPGGYGAEAGMRTVALGQDAAGLPAKAGLTHADFHAGEPVAVPRSSGRHAVGRVTTTWPGWVRVDVEQGASKDVPEGSVYRLLENLRLA